MTRLFFAVDLPPSIRRQLTSLQSALQDNGFAARNWSPSSLFHLTLEFLGDKEDALRPFLEQAAWEVAAAHSGFSVTLSSLGVFVEKRVLWLGLTPNQGLTQLRSLQAALVQSLATKLSSPWEQRSYHPHLTLARQVARDSISCVDDYRSLTEKVLTESEFSVMDFCLCASTRLEGRLAYPILTRFPLAKDNQ